MNKLVRHNLVRGLPTKCFENDHNYTACLKGKQHKVSCKTKLLNSVTKPLHTLHMDLFGPTSELRVKTIRCDNRGEFQNKEMNDFCSKKCIKREFSNARTPQQNGVAERRNRTLIEAARTMLADAKLPVTFWAEAVNTACYVQNSVVVNKSQNKTSYELFNVVVVDTNSTNFLGTKEATGQDVKKDVPSVDAPESSGNSNPTATSTNPLADHIETLAMETLIPTISSLVLTAYLSDSPEPSSDTRLISKRVTSQDDTPSLDNILSLTNRFEDIFEVTTNTDDTNGVEANLGNMETTIIASPTPTLRIHKDHPKSQIIGHNVWSLVDCPKGVRPIGTKWVLKNKKDERGIVIRNKAKLVAQRHTQEERIDYDEVFTPVTRIEAIRLFLAYASFIGFTVYQMDVKSAFLYGTIDEEVYVMQPPGFQDLEFPARVYKVEKAMYGLHQAPRAWLSMPCEALSKEISSFILLLIETTKEGTNILAIVDGKLRTIFESSIRRNHKPNDEAGISSLTDAELFENLTLMGYNISPNQKFTFQKGQFSHQRKYLIHTIMQCLSPKSTRFNEFSSNITTALGEGSGTPTEPHHTPSPEAQQTSPTTHSSPSLPPMSLDDSQGEACPTDSSFKADQDKANIAKTSTLPNDSTPRVTSLVADEGSMKQKLDELMALRTNLQRQQSEMISTFILQELEINRLKARLNLLEDKDRGVVEQSRDDAPIKGRRLDEGEEAAERVSDDTEEMATVLTSMDAASILTSGGVQVVPTAAEVATTTVSIPTGSGVVFTASPTIPTAAPIFTTATESTPYTRRKGKEKMVESKTPKKKKKIQEQTDIQMAKELEEEMARDAQRMSEQIARDKEIAKMMQLVPAEEIYIEALQFKHPIIDWEVYTEGQRSYWKIIRLGGSSASYQFFVDLLKHLDREDLNQLKALVKETLTIRPTISDKEMELWVELKRLYEPDVEDQLWTHTQNLMHAPVEWKLYDTCRVHYVTSKDKEIFMLVEKDYPLRKGLAIVMISYKL
uniref:Retrovirus-related Pol polyprotein from transposon TNT 1-94 n=1 Tax=Tanacetum cinerariifolium TaxID=118510 RepID=A0A6L2LA40_TANCI|nr:retrovirus-related Pol polyprotein from transposon TNT 1-94 [Tanacetum cinerariifolium]